MTECFVTCSECDKPRKWRFLCEDCAQDKQAEHSRATGHQPHLTVVPDRDTVFALIAKAGHRG